MKEIGGRIERIVLGGQQPIIIRIESLNPSNMRGFKDLTHGYYKVEYNKNDLIIALTPVELSKDEKERVPFEV